MGGDAHFARLRDGAFRDDLWPDPAPSRGGTPTSFVISFAIAMCGAVSTAFTSVKYITQCVLGQGYFVRGENIGALTERACTPLYPFNDICRRRVLV